MAGSKKDNKETSGGRKDGGEMQPMDVEEGGANVPSVSGSSGNPSEMSDVPLSVMSSGKGTAAGSSKDRKKKVAVRGGARIITAKSKKRRKRGAGMSDDDEGEKEKEQERRGEIANIRRSLKDIVESQVNEIDISLGETIMNVADRYELMISTLMNENARIRGQLAGMDTMKDELINGLNSRVGKLEGEVTTNVVNGVKQALKKYVHESVTRAVSKEVVTPQTREEMTSRRSYAVIVKGKEGEQPGLVKELVEKTVGKETNIRVRALRETKDGGIAIETVSEEERKMLMRNEEFKNRGMSISEAKRVAPRMIIYDIPQEWNDDYVIQELWRRNLHEAIAWEEMLGRSKVVMRNGKRNGNTVNLVIECPYAMRERMLRMGRVFVDTCSFRINIFEKVFRCYKCYGFGHRASECKEEELCRRCGEPGHKGDACRKSETCRNCRKRSNRDDHSIFSPDCPEYRWRLDMMRTRIDYE